MSSLTEHPSPSSHQRTTRTDTSTASIPTTTATNMNGAQRGNLQPPTITLTSAFPLPPTSFSPSSTFNPTATMMMASPLVQQPVQLVGIVYPHPHDVLCGRGKHLWEYRRLFFSRSSQRSTHIRLFTIIFLPNLLFSIII